MCLGDVLWPNSILKGAFSSFGVHVLLVQKSLKKLQGAHFFNLVQRPSTRHSGGGSSKFGGPWPYIFLPIILSYFHLINFFNSLTELSKNWDLWKMFNFARPVKFVFIFNWGSSSRRVKILTVGIHWVFRGLKFEPDAEIWQKGAFCKGLL